jgi:hypothetical protein
MTMAEGHLTESKGRKILEKRLATAGRIVEESCDRTFDLIVDGEYAEVKATGNGWDKFDFIRLTNAIVEIHADDLQKCVCRKILHYEWNKGAIQHLRK